MNERLLKKFVIDTFNLAGVSVNGDKPWDIQVYNEQFYPRIIKHGSIGLGESYMENWWDCEALDQFFDRVIQAKLDTKIKLTLWEKLKIAFLTVINLQTKKKALLVGKKHYDLGNDLFQVMLDKEMNYTCGYWLGAKDLDTAQQNKMALTCQKLKLKPGMRVLDIGCGFGSLAKYAAKHFGVSVVGITISKEQVAYAKKNTANLPIEIRFQDYREVTGVFDRIVSLGMFEHVGHLNYRTYMQVVRDHLKDDGLFLLHTIGNNMSCVYTDPWISKYIFPNGHLPSIAQIGKATENVLVMEDWHNFSAYYDKTLMAWYHRFTQHWDDIKKNYNDTFFRMWRYYLLVSAGAFRARSIQLWQIVLSKEGIIGGYQVSRELQLKRSLIVP